ncbi:hypothetical protein JKP88DRAFT_301763, partial [Tribonema minus]
ASTGAIAAAYAALEELGFAFFHPLQPLRPEALSVPLSLGTRLESPRWHYRGFHVHTQHPLELTDVLQGFDIVEAGSSAAEARKLAAAKAGHQQEQEQQPDSLGWRDESGAGCGETWDSMLRDVELFFEWCAANRVNRVQWLLLADPHGERRGGGGGGGAARLALRQVRLARLAALAHAFGLLAGVDVPIGLQQQHAWYMVSPRQAAAEQARRIRERCDWVAQAGFDFVSTESGLSEFTHPGDELMLSLIDTFATYVNETLQLPATIKVHCSQGQTCANYPDPRADAGSSAQPLNFNFLPTYANPAMGVMPHTVQAYGLDDFSANVYGNADFSEMRDYMFYEAKKGERAVVYYGETAYWVSVDVDVPLFLPLYGERRLHDLRLIAREEEAQGFSIDGQMNFDSGWEWGYWLNDVITARAAWDPHTGAATDAEALSSLLQPVLARALGAPTAQRLTAWLQRLTSAQHALLVRGSHSVDSASSSNSTAPHPLLTGVAYLSGSDTWFEVPRMAGLAGTQPDRVLAHQWRHAAYGGVAPLLRAMDDAFTGFADEMRLIAQDHCATSTAGSRGSGEAFNALLQELQDGIDMLALRAKHVRLLYKAQAPSTDSEHAKALLAQSRSVIGRAKEIVSRREANYRAPVSRIAAWRESGPTVYRYGYLWAVHSLYYWWRDQGRAEAAVLQRSRPGACYLNRMDPVQVAFGWGKQTFQAIRMAVAAAIPLHSDAFTNCLAPPAAEYKFPQDLHKY